MTGRQTDDDVPRRAQDLWPEDRRALPDGEAADPVLDAAFAALRAAPPQPPQALMARLHADAARSFPDVARPAAAPAVAPPRPSDPRRGTVTARPLDTRAVPRPAASPVRRSWQGRGGVMAGLMAAGLAGLWIGAASPAPVVTLGAAMGLELGATAEPAPVTLDLSESAWSLLETLGEG